MWADCDEDTSHTCSNGYAIDVWDGRVVGGIGQYSAHFNNDKKEGKLNGKIIKKIEEACKVIVASHKMLNKTCKWCPAVGWDFMLDDKEEIVYFEGNQASYRIPRIIFFNFNNMIDFFTDIFWPFDDKYSVQP